jgi:hypothetical protein
MDWIHLAQDRVHGNEPSGSIKGGEFLSQLRNCQVLQKVSVA